MTLLLAVGLGVAPARAEEEEAGKVSKIEATAGEARSDASMPMRPLPEEDPLGSVVRDVVYGHKDGMALVYDVLRPKEPNGAAIAYIVSGGWFSRWQPPEERAEGFVALLQRGFTMIVVHHGSAPRYRVPDAVSDVIRAVRHIRRTARVYGVDPERIGLFGGSAGGHLALISALAGDAGDPQAEDPVLREPNRVAAVAAYYPPTDLRAMVGPNADFPALDFPSELAPRVSPLLYVSADDPPTLLVHGDEDDVVPLDHSVRLEAALSGVGAEVRLVRIRGAGHGFRDPAHRALASGQMQRWFERHLLAPAR